MLERPESRKKNRKKYENDKILKNIKNIKTTIYCKNKKKKKTKKKKKKRLASSDFSESDS